jgi:gliding motility-associated lipoprotein GldH|tara:strand:- start:71 stop:553 length:483 start_codon:yes stop_codon:yes gene_type:complete
MKIKKSLFFLLFILCLGSCSGPYFLEFTEFSSGWENTETAEFNFKGGLSPKNMSLILRHNNDYDYANIFLILELNSTLSLVQTDTLEFLLSNPNGQWLGDKKLTLIEHKLPYQQSIILAKDSLYTLRVRTSMRLNGQVKPIVNLEGIIGLGLLIEEENKE